jgi:hypothetical protein
MRPPPTRESPLQPSLDLLRYDLQTTKRGEHPMGLIIVIILILLLVGAVPHWGYSRGWGYGPSGLLGLILIIVVILLLMGRL